MKFSSGLSSANSMTRQPARCSRHLIIVMRNIVRRRSSASYPQSPSAFTSNSCRWHGANSRRCRLPRTCKITHSEDRLPQPCARIPDSLRTHYRLSPPATAVSSQPCANNEPASEEVRASLRRSSPPGKLYRHLASRFESKIALSSIV